MTELIKIIESCVLAALIGVAVGELLRRAGAANVRGKR